jgi:hypothetical protein
MAEPVFLSEGKLVTDKGVRVPSGALSDFQNTILTMLKTSTTTRTATVASAADPHLAVSVPANVFFIVEGILLVTAPTTSDFRVQFDGDGNTAGNLVVSGLTSALAVNPPLAVTRGTDVVVGTSGGAAIDAFLVRGWLFQNTAAATFQIKWAQGTSDAGNTQLLLGSHIRLTPYLLP